MESPLRVRDVMTREYVAVSEGDPIPETAEIIRRERSPGAIVLRGQEPVGVLRPRDFLGVISDRSNLERTTVSDLMVAPPPVVAASASFQDALRDLTTLETGLAVVEDADRPVGVVSERDLLSAKRMLLQHDDRTEATAVGPAAMADTTEQGDADDLVQSVCEQCGSLSGSLIQENGRLVCPDCREL